MFNSELEESITNEQHLPGNGKGEGQIRSYTIHIDCKENIANIVSMTHNEGLTCQEDKFTDKRNDS